MENRPQDAPNAKRQRVPPHSLNAESALLGAMLLSVDAIADVEGMVQAGHFYRPCHAAVFDAILSVSREGGKPDAIVVHDRLDQQHLDALGGLDGLLLMQQDTPATSNAPRYAETVRECAMRRNLLSTCQEVIAEAYEGPCDSAAVLDRAREQFLARDTSPAKIDAVPLYDSLDKALTTLEDINEGRDPRRAPTGFPDLDAFLSGGLVPSGFYVLGARPAMGKSALAAEMALNIANSSGPVLLVTLEMPDEDIAMRLMASRGRVESRRMLDKAKTIKEWDQIHRAVIELKDAPLFLMSHSGATVTDVRRAARQVRAREGSLRLVVVDYLQLMGSLGSFGRRERPETRQLEIAEITRSLKVMAGEMGCAVLAVVTAQPRSRGPHRQAPVAVGPARVRRHRAGRRCGDAAVPRRVLQARRPQVAGAGRSEHRQEPQRTLGSGGPRVREPLHGVRASGQRSPGEGADLLAEELGGHNHDDSEGEHRQPDELEAPLLLPAYLDRHCDFLSVVRRSPQVMSGDLRTARMSVAAVARRTSPTAATEPMPSQCRSAPPAGCPPPRRASSVGRRRW